MNKININITYKLSLLFGVVYLVVAGVLLFTFHLQSTYFEQNQKVTNYNALSSLNSQIIDKLSSEARIISHIADRTTKAEVDGEWSEFSKIQPNLKELFDSIQNLGIEEKKLVSPSFSESHEKDIFEPFSEIYRTRIQEIIVAGAMADSAITEQPIIESLLNIANNVVMLSNELEANIRLIEIETAKLLEQNKQDIHTRGLQFLIVALIVIGISIVIVAIGLKMILLPVSKVRKFINAISRGDLNVAHSISSRDEIEDMAHKLSSYIAKLRLIASLLKEAGNAKFDNEYTLASEDDILGKSFIEMRDNLQAANNERIKMKEQEDMQNWATTGFAQFGEILRRQTKNNSELAYNIIKGLVEYIDANQGGVFIVMDENENDVHLELLAAYAYGRKKFLQKRVEFGEGLVGICALETETIYMTELPEDYIEIESYLGHANPRSLLIVPLKIDDKLFGIIELASFKEFTQNEIKFVEDLAETIASTLSTAKINAKTAELLDKSREQSEVLLAQEEEMRQNLEELQSTQEEASRRERMLSQELQTALNELEELKAQLGKQV